MAETDTDEWEELADELHAHGVPERRAAVVALVATGHTHAETAAVLGLERGGVGTQVTRYRERDLANAEWLAEHAPEL